MRIRISKTKPGNPYAMILVNAETGEPIQNCRGFEVRCHVDSYVTIRAEFFAVKDDLSGLDDLIFDGRMEKVETEKEGEKE